MKFSEKLKIKTIGLFKNIILIEGRILKFLCNFFYWICVLQKIKMFFLEDLLLKYQSDQTLNQKQKRIDMNPVYEKEFEVEEVLQKLVNIATDKSYFLIKWEGYQQLTYEPKQHLENCIYLVEEYEEKGEFQVVKKKNWDLAEFNRYLQKNNNQPLRGKSSSKFKKEGTEEWSAQNKSFKIKRSNKKVQVTQVSKLLVDFIKNGNQKVLQKNLHNNNSMQNHQSSIFFVEESLIKGNVLMKDKEEEEQIKKDIDMIPEEEDGHLGNIQVLLAVKRKEKIKFKIATKNGEKKWKGKEYMMKNYPNQMVTYYEIKIFENGQK